MEAEAVKILPDLEVYDIMNKEAERFPGDGEGMIILPYLMGKIIKNLYRHVKRDFEDLYELSKR